MIPRTVWRKLLLAAVLLAVLLGAPSSAAAGLADQVEMHTLDNGLRVIMVVRDYAPIIGFQLMFDVGGIDEPDGLGGIAHMVEHMAFMGTPSVGSHDYETERQLLEEVETAADAYFAAIEAEAGPEELQPLEEQFTQARLAAQQVAEADVLKRLFDRQGGTGHNAATGYDFTFYTVTLPANRLELFARIKADLLVEPVFRFFYEEVDVVKEERRQINEDDPTGFLMEHHLATAFTEHPYGRPLIGSMDEIAGYRTEEALAFWNAHYHPNRAVLVMVGDVDPEQDLAMIQHYFGGIPAGPKRDTQLPEEPPQTEERRIEVGYDAEPEAMIGFHRPTYPDPDAYVLDALNAVLGSGRTSRLFRRLVVEDQLALWVSTSSRFPGTREPSQLLIHFGPRYPHTAADVEAAVYEEIRRLQDEPIKDWELEKVHNQVRASFVRNLQSTSGLARELAFYELFLDGWENLMAYPEVIAAITAEAIQQAAQTYLTAENRTVSVLVTERSDEGSGER